MKHLHSYTDNTALRAGLPFGSGPCGKRYHFFFKKKIKIHLHNARILHISKVVLLYLLVIFNIVNIALILHIILCRYNVVHLNDLEKFHKICNTLHIIDSQLGLGFPRDGNNNIIHLA